MHLGSTVAVVQCVIPKFFPKRDWLLMRGRLFSILRTSAVFVGTAGLIALGPAGCAAATEDDDEEPLAMQSEELSKAGGIEVIQCNPFYAGAYDRPDRSSPRNWRTARRFAKLIDRGHTHAAVIGMQEMVSPEATETMRTILQEETGRNWSVRFFNKKTGPDAKEATAEAIFWRPAVFDLIADFGTKEVDALDQGGVREAHSVRFGGLLLQRKGTSHRLAVFTGKLAWWGTESAGDPIDNGDRARQVGVLMRWIDEKMAAHPRARRVVMMDMNAVYGSAPHKKMLERFQDGASKEPSYIHKERGNKRLDYVFWDYDSSKSRPDGVFGKPVVSADFGSDHRFVAAKIYVGGPA